MVCRALLAFVGAAIVQGTEQKLHHHQNPVRKVVNMLRMMEAKVEAEGKKAEEAYDKFMCYCKNGRATLEQSIDEAEEQIPQLQSSLKESVATHQQLKEDLKSHKADIKDAEEAVGSATELRNSEQKTFDKDSANMQSNVDAMAKAIAALEKGLGGGFLQTSAASVLRRLVANTDTMGQADRDTLTSFLSSNSDDSAGGSGEIVGILKQMHEEMSADLAAMRSEEEKKVAAFNSLVAAKDSEIAALQKAIQAKTARAGEKAVEIANLKNQLEDTVEQLALNKEFAAELDKSCATKAKEWEEYSKMHQQEMLALSETVKILNDDDAMELFKKTVPSASAASFLQVSEQLRRRKAAAAILKRHKHDKNRQLRLLALGLSGHSQKGFDGVLKQIEDMKAMMAKEQADDDKKASYCKNAFDEADDQKKALERSVSDSQKEISEVKGRIENVVNEISELSASIKELDGQVEEQTAIRKEESAQHTEDMSANNAAIQLLDMAKKRLAKFYGPSLVQVRQHTEEEDVEALSFVQTKIKAEQPEAYLQVQKQNSGGVMEMINTIISDIKMSIQKAEFEEKTAQGEYEEFIAESGKKRAEDSKCLEDKESSKAEMENDLQTFKSELKSSKANLMETEQEIANLHGECDWLLKNFDVRKEARDSETEALTKAAAVLSGAKLEE